MNPNCATYSRHRFQANCDYTDFTLKHKLKDFRAQTLKCLRCELSSGPLEGECIPVLSFPDASGSTPAKSTRSELSSPLD